MFSPKSLIIWQYRYSNIETNSAPLKLVNENLLYRMLVRLRQQTHGLSQSILLTNFSMIRIFLLPITLRNTEVFPYIPFYTMWNTSFAHLLWQGLSNGSPWTNFIRPAASKKPLVLLYVQELWFIIFAY